MMQHEFPMEPIIRSYVTESTAQMEDDCLKVCQRYGFDVNKERLQQALTDARKFYEEGYEAGKRATEEAARERVNLTLELDDPHLLEHFEIAMNMRRSGFSEADIQEMYDRQLEKDRGGGSRQ